MNLSIEKAGTQLTAEEIRAVAGGEGDGSCLTPDQVDKYLSEAISYYERAIEITSYVIERVVGK
jgi:hypothetical protein